MLIVEKQMFSFRLPFTTHFCKHDLDLALSTIKPEEMPQEKVVLAVQKIAVTRAQLRVRFHLAPRRVFVRAVRASSSGVGLSLWELRDVDVRHASAWASGSIRASCDGGLDGSLWSVRREATSALAVRPHNDSSSLRGLRSLRSQRITGIRLHNHHHRVWPHRATDNANGFLAGSWARVLKRMGAHSPRSASPQVAQNSPHN